MRSCWTENLGKVYFQQAQPNGNCSGETSQISTSFHSSSSSLVNDFSVQIKNYIYNSCSGLWQSDLDLKELPNFATQEVHWCGHQDFIRLHVLGMEGCLNLQQASIWLVKGIFRTDGSGHGLFFLPASFLWSLFLLFIRSRVRKMATREPAKKQGPQVPFF